LKHLSLSEYGAILPGMQIPLLAHQVLGGMYDLSLGTFHDTFIDSELDETA
jgi:hypothetical protein